MELLTSSRTLREVVAVLEEGIRPSRRYREPGPATAAAAETIAPFEPRPAETERIGRFVVHPSSAPAIAATAGLDPGGIIAIIDDGSGPPRTAGEPLAGSDGRC